MVILIDYAHLVPHKHNICRSLNYLQSIRFHLFPFLNEKLKFTDIDFSKITQIIETKLEYNSHSPDYLRLLMPNGICQIRRPVSERAV